MNSYRQGDLRAPLSYGVGSYGAEGLVPGSQGEAGEKRVGPGEKRQLKRWLLP